MMRKRKGYPVYPLTAAQKFGGQFVIALIAVWLGGVRINVFIDNSWITGALTVFWIMLLMNSINFFDNMDGLAVGTVTIAMGFFTILAALNHQFFIAGDRGAGGADLRRGSRFLVLQLQSGDDLHGGFGKPLSRLYGGGDFGGDHLFRH